MMVFSPHYKLKVADALKGKHVEKIGKEEVLHFYTTIPVSLPIGS
jgi:hypothetical protein